MSEPCSMHNAFFHDLATCVNVSYAQQYLSYMLVDAVCHLKYFISSFITSLKTNIRVLDKNIALSNSN